MRIFVVLIAAAALQACTSPAVISNISDSSVHVQSGMGTTPSMVQREAEKGCAIYNKVPVELSYTCMDRNCFRKTILFACKDDGLSTSALSPQSAPPQPQQTMAKQQPASPQVSETQTGSYGFRVIKRNVGRTTDSPR